MMPIQKSVACSTSISWLALGSAAGVTPGVLKGILRDGIANSGCWDCGPPSGRAGIAAGRADPAL